MESETTLIHPVSRDKQIADKKTKYVSSVAKFIVNRDHVYGDHTSIFLESFNGSAGTTELRIKLFDDSPVPQFNVQFTSQTSDKCNHADIKLQCVSKPKEKRCGLRIIYPLGEKKKIDTIVYVHLPKMKLKSFRSVVADAKLTILPSPQWKFEDITLEGPSGEITIDSSKTNTGLEAEKATLISGDAPIKGRLVIDRLIWLEIRAMNTFAPKSGVTLPSISVDIDKWKRGIHEHTQPSEHVAIREVSSKTLNVYAKGTYSTIYGGQRAFFGIKDKDY